MVYCRRINTKHKILSLRVLFLREHKTLTLRVLFSGNINKKSVSYYYTDRFDLCLIITPIDSICVLFLTPIDSICVFTDRLFYTDRFDLCLIFSHRSIRSVSYFFTPIVILHRSIRSVSYFHTDRFDLCVSFHTDRVDLCVSFHTDRFDPCSLSDQSFARFAKNRILILECFFCLPKI